MRVFQDGRSVRAASVVAETGVKESNLADMTKAELLAEAERRGVEVKESDTKAEILAALGG